MSLSEDLQRRVREDEEMQQDLQDLASNADAPDVMPQAPVVPQARLQLKQGLFSNFFTYFFGFYSNFI